MRLVIFDDRDLIQTASGLNVMQTANDQAAKPGFHAAIQQMDVHSHIFTICRNADEIARKTKSFEQVCLELQFCLNLLFPQQGRTAYFCPTIQGKTCQRLDWRGVSVVHPRDLETVYRKPATGMWQAAMQDNRIDAPNTIVIGSGEDQSMAASLGIEFIDAENWMAQYIPR